MTKVVVTGGAGFIGSHLTDFLLKKGFEVVVIDNLSNGRMENLKEAEKNPNFKFIKADIRKLDEIKEYFKNSYYVFHLAALADIVPSIENPTEYFETNVSGTFNVLQACKDQNVKKIIYVASSSSYAFAVVTPTPEDAPIASEYTYALTKNMGEQLVMHFNKIYKLPAIALRFFNVYGPRARTSGTYGAVFGVFLAQKLNKKPFTVVGDGEQTRDFTYVSDAVDALFTAANSNISGEVFNVGSGGHYSVNEIVKLLGGEKINIPKRPGEPDITFADVSKIKKLLNWEAKVSLKEGVALLLQNINAFAHAPVWDEKSIEKATKNWFKYLG